MQLYMLKDIARMSGQSIYTIKFYLKRGLIEEVGRSPETRFRYFDDSTLKRLAQIRDLRKQRKSLAEIQRVFTPSHPPEFDGQIAQDISRMGLARA